MRAALIRESDNQVINIIELDKESKWQAPEGHFVRFSDIASIGQFYIDNNFTDEP